MNPELSTYLNILRVFAALAVFVGHICGWRTNCGAVDRLPWLGGDGVVIFFVLSGYVITFTADKKDKTARAFFINRCARIYSVVIPALILTITLEIIGITYFPEKYNVWQNYQFTKIWAYIPLWLTFSSELWMLNEPILINGAFWSLCFEVWFYIALALSLFMRGAGRIIALLMVALIVGPKICILFPIWGLGVLAYLAQQRMSLRPAPARLLLLLSFLAYILVKSTGADAALTHGVNAALGNFPSAHLQMACEFPGKFLIACCIAANIFAMRFSAFPRIASIAYPVGLAASFTFTIYLTHLPLMMFFVALGGTAIDSMLWPTIMTLAAVIAIGLVTERRIGPWRAAFSRLVQFAERMAGSAIVATRRG